MLPSWTFSTIAPIDAPLPLSDSVDSKPRKWKKGICECFSNFGMCCCVLWCQPCALGQVASIVRNGVAWMCLLTAIAILSMSLTSGILQTLGNETASAFASVFGVLGSLITCLCVWNARSKYRTRDDIPDECGGLGDCLAGWCCSPCSICQMFSQDEIVACGGEGRPYKQFWSPYGEGIEDAAQVNTV